MTRAVATFEDLGLAWYTAEAFSRADWRRD
jgi:hypothetical protein